MRPKERRTPAKTVAATRRKETLFFMRGGWFGGAVGG
jgi:hypothetical protein